MIKALILSFLFLLTSCGDYVPVQQQGIQYQPYVPYPQPTSYKVKCYGWQYARCGYTVYACTNGIAYYCLNQAQALYFLN